MKDFMLLSKNITSYKIRELLDNNNNIICDLHDKWGRIGIKIKDIHKNHLLLIDNTEHDLEDKYLYNLIYIEKGNKYSLTEHDEYYEKIEISNDY